MNYRDIRVNADTPISLIKSMKAALLSDVSNYCNDNRKQPLQALAYRVYQTLITFQHRNNHKMISLYESIYSLPDDFCRSTDDDSECFRLLEKKLNISRDDYSPEQIAEVTHLLQCHCHSQRATH